jgi:type II secretory pathway pseudopilin PulG
MIPILRPCGLRLRFFFYAAGALLGLALGSLPARAQTTFNLDIFNFDFGTASTGGHIDPDIHVGDTVQWTWVTGVHSTTSAANQLESWDSGLHSQGFTFEHTFTNPGTYWYFCSLHGFDNGNGTSGGLMHGEVFVEPVPEPTSVLLIVGVAGALGYGVRRRVRRPSLSCQGGQRRGHSLIELVVVLAILATVLGLMIPAVQAARESANYIACRNNLKQISLAIHNHEATYGYYPGPGTLPHQDSPLVPLLPFLELGPVSRLIIPDHPLFIPIGDYGRLDASQAAAAGTVISLLLCPSDGQPAVGGAYDYAQLAGSNYGFNAGTGTGTYYDFRYPTDGVFWYGSRLRPKDVTDGVSNTVFVAESLRGPGADSYTPATADTRRAWMSMSCTITPATDRPGTVPPLTPTACMANAIGMSWRGDRNASWIGGPGHRTLFNTFAMPNDAMTDCGTFGLGWYKASSNHARCGVNIALGDGSVHFIMNHIDLSLWRALSTRGELEVLGDYCGCH